MTTLRVWTAMFALVVAGVAPCAVRADTIAELDERMASKQREYDGRLAAYNDAVEKREHLRSELAEAKVSVQVRGKDLQKARDRLLRIWKLFLEQPEVVSDADEKAAYTSAKAAHEEADDALNVKREKLAMAEGEVCEIRAALNGDRTELNNLRGQLANAQFGVLQESLSEERTVDVREEMSCGELTVRACQDGALERAKRSAVERASPVLLESTTMMEEWFSNGTTAGDVQVTETVDRIRSRVKGVLIRYDVIDDGWVGKTGYYYEIEAVVKGQISRADFFELLGVDGVPAPPPNPDRDRKRPGVVFRDCEECPEMMVVPWGEYWMGSPSSEEPRSENEGPQRQVKIGESFAVGVFEVTYDKWDFCVNEGGCDGYSPRTRWDWGRGKRPVVLVSWDDAQAYVRWLSQATGETYRLLSEAEWEYVARAGTTTAYHFGQAISAGDANYVEYGGGFGLGKTTPVGSFRPNAFGLYDVHGNVWEWVQDCWNESYEEAPADGSAREHSDCGRRMVRGGSWIDEPGFLRSAYRGWRDAVERNSMLGFRVARTLTDFCER